MGVSGKCDYTFNFAEFYRFILWLLNKQYSFVFFDRILCQMNHSLIVLSLIHGLQNIPCVHQSKIHCSSNLQTKSACLSMVYLWLMLGMRGSGTGQDEIFFIHISYTNLYLVFCTFTRPGKRKGSQRDPEWRWLQQNLISVRNEHIWAARFW